jgi:hypothetical protein
MKHGKRRRAWVLVAALLFGSIIIGWRAHGQGRPTPAQRQWEYQYETAAKSFPSDADKVKIDLYAANGWELVAAVREDSQTMLVFKRVKQPTK